VIGLPQGGRLYRDYRDEPLSATEIRALLKKLGLTGKEPAARLVKLMAENPTLLQRPIGVHGKKAVIGRPPENLLALL
jgi:arsenate reductase-like glutaredoxin family protein